MRRSEVAAAELERWCGRVKEEYEGGNEGENDKDPLPLIGGGCKGMHGNRGGQNHYMAIWTPRLSGRLL